jgi:hypothetical protein
MVLCSDLFPGIGYFGPGQICAIYIKHGNGKLCYGTLKKSSLQYSIALHHRATSLILPFGPLLPDRSSMDATASLDNTSIFCAHMNSKQLSLS